MSTFNLASVKIEGKIKSPAQVVKQLKALAEVYPGEIVYSTSFGLEAQVITHLIFSHDIPIEVFTVDTGRLFAETIQLKEQIEERYQKEIVVYKPEVAEVEDLLHRKGAYSFYESVQNREECCDIRKLHPLKKALAGKACWITGIRADQSRFRSKMKQWDWNDKYQLHKFLPLFHWTEADVQDFVAEHNLPYNALHERGYPSIGCEPCTRAVRPGDDPRSGRWWWEHSFTKECGMHK